VLHHLGVPVYWKPRYATRSQRHRAFVRRQAAREEAIRRLPHEPLLARLRRFVAR
jgi:hypothetical protein